MGKRIFPSKATIFLFVILISLSATSASGLEQVNLIKHNEQYSLGSDLSYLQDRGGKWSIDKIRRPSFSGKWQRNKNEVPAFGFTSSVYWFAVGVKNLNESPMEKLLELSYPLLDSVDLYIEREGQIVEKFHTGDQHPFAKRPIEHRHFLFPINIQQNDILTLYIRVQTSSAMQIPLVLWSERAFWKSNESYLGLQGLYFGIMLVMILYNMFIYTSVRDQSYLFYVLFVSCFTVFQLALAGLSYHYFWPQLPWFNQKILALSVATALMFGGLFTISLLGLKEQSFKLYWIMTLTSLIALIIAIAVPFLDYKSVISFCLADSLVMASIGLAAGCIMWKRNYAPARFYTIAWIGLLVGTIAFALSKIGIIPRNIFTENGVQLGSAIEVLLLSFALANRINTIRKEKELAQAESVSLLERYQALYENAIEGIFQLTLTFDFLSANRAMSHILGLTNKAKLFSYNFIHLKRYFLNQDDAVEFCRLLQEKGEVINREFRGQSTQHEEFWASISVRTIYNEFGKPKHYEGSLVDITKRREAEEQIRYQAYYDNVTGLPNRSLLQDLLQHALDRAKRNDELVAVLFVDLNRFKLVNDTFGHNVGDKLLQEVAARLSHCSRGGDWVGRPQPADAQQEEGGGNAVARLGGDEFVIVLTDIRYAEDAAIVAWRVGKALAKSFTLDDKEIYISASIGISTYPTDSDNPSKLLKQADAAMYHIKKQGIDGYQFHTDYFSVHASKRLAIETQLRKALNNDEFQLYYQPKLDLQSSRIVGVEALCRWQHPERGMVLPQEFIGVAEEIGLIVPIGEWVLQTACEQSKYWQKEGLPTLRTSVNLSSRQFIEPGLSKTILHTLEYSGLNPCELELELTESILMDDTETTGKLLNKLKDMGLFISIDDFGTGYSSLSYLKRFPVDILKIDRSFIHDITEDADDRGITSAIISMAQQLELKVIAEGVETEAQINYLREQKCDEVQGYFVSAPLPAKQFGLLLRRAEAGLSLKTCLP